MRVVTYNIHKCRGMDQRVRPGRIAEVLGSIDADVAALQEVTAGQARILAEELKMHYVFGENRKLREAGYGNAIFSKQEVMLHRNHDLSVAGREPRGCLCADIPVNGAMLHIFNLHLGTDFFERREQARRLVTPELMRAPDLSGPRIVLGDFNDWTRGHVSHVLAAEFRNADLRVLLKRQRTYPALLPVVHLDHIYYDEALLLESVRLHRSRLALVASDHLPLVADFQLASSVESKA